MRSKKSSPVMPSGIPGISDDALLSVEEDRSRPAWALPSLQSSAWFGARCAINRPAAATSPARADDNDVPDEGDAQKCRIRFKSLTVKSAIDHLDLADDAAKQNNTASIRRIIFRTCSQMVTWRLTYRKNQAAVGRLFLRALLVRDPGAPAPSRLNTKKVKFRAPKKSEHRKHKTR